MRIVAGKYKGRTLYGFDGTDIRPTSDMARESLFNILQTRIAGANFLDLFCGSGAVGIEALSRGVSWVTFNDLDAYSAKLTQKNLEKVGATDYDLRRGDGVDFLRRTDKKYDIIFIDPPYKSDLGERALKEVQNALSEDGIVIYENEKPFEGVIDGLSIYDERKYGRARLTFFKREK
ncbi:MAG: 16S rRNA (guanine(966)-N(2))-methyltransferase RsmD [Clostridia bacterium]|nr:16S rRNA (guanine(966)-N(2))-methyltransferase RsmD [Clostridia bacterium]